MLAQGIGRDEVIHQRWLAARDIALVGAGSDFRIGVGQAATDIEGVGVVRCFHFDTKGLVIILDDLLRRGLKTAFFRRICEKTGDKDTAAVKKMLITQLGLNDDVLGVQGRAAGVGQPGEQQAVSLCSSTLAVAGKHSLIIIELIVSAE